MGPKDGALYDAYGATMVSWGGFVRNENARNWFLGNIATAHERDMRYCPGLAFRTAFAGMIDFDENFEDSICLTLDGEKILVPWLWDHGHEGHPAYWFCTNAPGYRAYLRWQAQQAMLVDVEGLHIDDYAGTAGTEWRGGCFCAHCMAAFREWLPDHVPTETLADLGIESLDGFDYGVFLRDSGIDTETYRKRVENDLPLGREYLTFQYTSASAFVDEVRKYAENLVKHPLMLSVNSAANGAKSLVIADKLTYFCGEVDRDAEEREFATKPILVFKLGDALDRPQVSTASGQDWAYCMEHDLTGLVRTWVAQSYAYGHQLMAPVKQWAYTKEKGTHWWETDPDDFTDLYQFIRANAALFDDHDAIADVGLVYSNANFRRYQRQAAKVAVELAHANVPFRLLLAGDDWLPNRITAKDVADLKAIIVTEPLDLDAEQQTVLDAAADRVISLDRLPGMLAPQVTVTGADNVTVIPRATADGRYAIHLVNRNYDGESDAMIAQTEFTVSLSTSLFDGEPNSATLHAPGAEPVALALTKSPDAIDLRIPTLDLWAIIEIVVP